MLPWAANVETSGRGERPDEDCPVGLDRVREAVAIAIKKLSADKREALLAEPYFMAFLSRRTMSQPQTSATEKAVCPLLFSRQGSAP